MREHGRGLEGRTVGRRAQTGCGRRRRERGGTVCGLQGARVQANRSDGQAGRHASRRPKSSAILARCVLNMKSACHDDRRSSVLQHDTSKSAAAKITKLDTAIFHHESWKPICFEARRPKVKVTKNKKQCRHGFYVHFCKCWLLLIFVVCNSARRQPDNLWQSVK